MSQVRPCQTSRFGLADGPVGVRHEGVEPDDIRGDVGVDVRAAARIERQRAGEEVEPEVQSAAPMHQVLQLLVGLGIADAGIDVDQRRGPAP